MLHWAVRGAARRSTSLRRLLPLLRIFRWRVSSAAEAEADASAGAGGGDGEVESIRLLELYEQVRGHRYAQFD